MIAHVVNKFPKKSFSLICNLLTGINLLLGLILWFGYLFNYSWVGTLPNILFPPIIGIVALISVVVIMLTSAGRITKIITGLLACIPSLAGGCLPVLLAIVLLITPLGLGVMLVIADIFSEETLIQQAMSPDGSEIANVYLKGTGAYTGEHGQIAVRVKNRLFPVIEHEVYYVSDSEADRDTTDYLSWKDNRTLYVPETQEEIEIGVLGVNIRTVRY